MEIDQNLNLMVCTFVGMTFDLLSTYLKSIFHLNFQLFGTWKFDKDQDPDPHGSVFVFAPWIRIRIKIKSWIRICIETNADPQHWRIETLFCTSFC